MELTQLLKDAQLEIQQLRRRNEILGAKVEVMDSFMCVLHTKPAEHLQGVSVDIAWQLGQKVAELGQKVDETKRTNRQRRKMPNAEVSEGWTRDSRIETAAQSRPSLH